MDTRAAGRLNGWDFEMTSAVWRDTSLFLRQDGGKPEGLRLRITFPLKGGDLVPGKTFRIGPSSPPFDTPIRIIWQDELGADHRESIASGYVLLIRFDTVSTEEITGRVHLCLPDVAQSWVAGRFVAQNLTSTP
jgi:hypothetical protein